MSLMKKRPKSDKEIDKLDRLARKTDDIRPLSPAMRGAWEAAKQTGAKMGRGRPRKDPRLKSRIVPISMDPALLAEIDRFAKTTGVSRSKLVAQGLKLRMKTREQVP